MEMSAQEWLRVLRREYLQEYIRLGGATVKCVVTPQEHDRQAVAAQIRQMAQEEGYVFAQADAREVKIHLIDRLFHHLARQIDWDALARLFVVQCLQANGYQIPGDPETFGLSAIAMINNREELCLRREMRTWLERALFRDSYLCQEFRMAMLRLCLAQLDQGDPDPFLAQAVKDWLRGELRWISPLKATLIFQKIVRHNARHMFASLAHWIRLVGKSGWVVALDLSQYLAGKRLSPSDRSLYYSAAATLDVYELLRQFIDSTDELEGCLLVVLAPPVWLTDTRRGLPRYEALKLRIWDDVRDRHRQNPLAPLVRLTSSIEESPGWVLQPSHLPRLASDRTVQHQRAIEALRAGVPNRDAVTMLGCAQPEIEGQFRRMLDEAQASVQQGTTTAGMLLEGGFGTGKSHVLEYLEQVALERHFVCSRIVISKETPLYSLPKMFQAAIESLRIPQVRGGSLAEIAGSLNVHGPHYADLYEWAHGGELDSRFAATLFLYERMRNDQELSHRLVRFWSGDPLGIGELKRYLQACDSAQSYGFSKMSAMDLALQRFKFAARLMVAAGYAGWILFIDEVELIGRYSLMQRAKSYVEIARWLGALEASSYADVGYRSGLAAVVALTDDFHSAILEEKGDREKIPLKLHEAPSETDRFLASQAEIGMRLMETRRTRLVSPYDRFLEEVQEKLRQMHGAVYVWDPPWVPSVERLSSTRMREYIKGWITEWDLRRLYPEREVEIEVSAVHPTYTEDHLLELSPERSQSAFAESTQDPDGGRHLDPSTQEASVSVTLESAAP
ncbi:MAG: hypothetical protein D6704_01765 [Nitrospirae bacterium]|nr:MAG: hypothetical protein D6704_01765 [Nitrospirota bacterium]